MINLDEEINRVLSKVGKMPNYDKAYYESLKPKIRDALIELETNHNTSWAVEMYRRNSKNLNSIAIKYRGNKINYRGMFNKAYQYAKALKQLGYKKGDQIPVCVTNIPEFVYTFLAISMVGCQANIVGEWFNKDYLLSILNDTKSKYMFVSDNIYADIKDVIYKSNVENIVMFSLADSLPRNNYGDKFDPYEEFDDVIYHINNRVSKYKLNSEKAILNEEEFSKIGTKYNGNVVEDCSLSDPFTITYTSGTTDPGCPKGCIHANRSYIALSRFKESDVSGMPSMRNLTVLAHIPTYTHMELSCAISDTLYEKCTLAMEPFYRKDFFIFSLLINEPNFVPASVGFWTHTCKLLNYDKKFNNIDMPFLMLPTVTGEGMSSGEEKFFNYTSRKHKFGTKKLPFPLAPVTFSIGGGTGESSGIFVLLYKALQEKALNNLIKKNTLGHNPHKFARVEVINENGEFCKVGEPGMLVVDSSSPCNMISYTDPTLNRKLIIYDKYGKKWIGLGAIGIKSDSAGRIKMKGRPSDYITSISGEKIPYYVIEDEVMRDTKNIMSCTLVKISCDGEEKYVCHIELQPEHKKSSMKVIESCVLRLNKILPNDILESLYFRERSFNESFDTAPSGKRDRNSLVNEGRHEVCIPCLQYLNNKVKTTNGKVKKLKKQ